MIKIEAPKNIGSLIDDFHSLGGVIEFDFYDIAPEIVTDLSHRDVAKLHMDECAIGHRNHQQNLQAQGYDTRNWKPYIWNETKLQGTEIELSEFLGTYAIEPEETSSSSWSIPNADGFTTAFFHPPYGLKGELSVKLKLYEEIITNLGCNDRPESLMIRSWATDCSSYFDAGHEWWGAYFWTLSKLSRPSIAVITASATD